MSGMIKLSGSGGSNNNPPRIKNFRQEGELESRFFDIKYIAEDFENTILRHYIYIDGQKKEISKDVGYEKPNNEFTYRVSNLNINTKYNIQIEVTDGIETVRSDIISVSTLNYVLYGIRVMENNSNPQTCCTYIEESIGVQVANSTSLGGWKDKFPFNKIRMVGFKNGKITKTINPNNKTQYVGGGNIPTDVDVMVEIPKVYWKVKNIANGYELRISDYKIDSSYDCYAHKVNGIEKDYIYIGVYLGCNEGGKLRSKSGVNPTVSQTLNSFRNYAQANGEGYQLFNYFSLLLLQNLYLIAYKNLDSQSALGKGYCNASVKTSTGGTNTKGLVYGETGGYQQMCFLGIEDLWGNLYQFIDGVRTDTSYNVYVDSTNKTFNDSISSYEKIATVISSSGYVSKVTHNNKGVFIATETKGSANTYYSDQVYNNYNKNVRFGGRYNDNSNCGIFSLCFNMTSSDSGAGLTSRLCYLG